MSPACSGRFVRVAGSQPPTEEPAGKQALASDLSSRGLKARPTFQNPPTTLFEPPGVTRVVIQDRRPLIPSCNLMKEPSGGTEHAPSPLEHNCI